VILGERDEHLPPNHCFDEFYGNLYHLNAKEEKEYPANPETPLLLKHPHGPHMNSWPDAGMTPFRSEKNSNWKAPSA
jgi:hypothetical protein